MYKTKYKQDYYNNKFNFLISELSDKKRSIMDIDCFISKIGCQYSFIIDHKQGNDKTSINTLRQLSKFSDIKLQDNTIIKCFIVRSEIDINKIKTNNQITNIYEIKNFKNVKDLRDKNNYLKKCYYIHNDNDLKDFFNPKTHNEIILKLTQK